MSDRKIPKKRTRKNSGNKESEDNECDDHNDYDIHDSFIASDDHYSESEDSDNYQPQKRGSLDSQSENIIKEYKHDKKKKKLRKIKQSLDSESEEE